MGRVFFPPLVSPVGASVLKQAVFLTDMKTNRDTLVRMNTVLTDMKQSSAQLHTSLRDVKTSMEQTLMDPQCSSPTAAPTCDSIRKSLSVLDGSANFDHVRRGQSCSRAVSLGRLGRLQRGSPTRGPVAGGRGSSVSLPGYVATTSEWLQLERREDGKCSPRVLCHSLIGTYQDE